MSKLKIENFSYQFNDGDYVRKILDEVTYEFDENKLYAILGYSGSGKTTLISAMAGLDSINNGKLLLDGREVVDLAKYRMNDVSTVFQSYNLITYMNAFENVEVAAKITQNKMPEDLNSVIYNLLDFVGISKSKAQRRVTKLSGGEQQRVAIARALITNGSIIFADEPTGNLDSQTQREIVEIFKTLTREYNKTILIVTHSDEVANLADVVLRLKDGKLEQDEKFIG